MPIPYHEAQAAATTTHTPPPSSSPSKWGPYSGAGDFSTNMVVILVILFCALVLALAVNAVVRYLLCSFRRQPHSSDPEKCSDDRKAQTQAVESSPTLLFSAAAATKLAGAEAECAICLAEFADGDRVRLLPKCNHGFHVSCIEKWLVSRKSCPTCRASCHVSEV